MRVNTVVIVPVGEYGETKPAIVSAVSSEPPSNIPANKIKSIVGIAGGKTRELFKGIDMRKRPSSLMSDKAHAKQHGYDQVQKLQAWKGYKCWRASVFRDWYPHDWLTVFPPSILEKDGTFRFADYDEEKRYYASVGTAVPGLRELRTVENEAFERYFVNVVREGAQKLQCLFFMDQKECCLFNHDGLEGADLSGWLLPFCSACSFEEFWVKGNKDIPKQYRDNYAVASWKKTENGYDVDFLSYNESGRQVNRSEAPVQEHRINEMTGMLEVWENGIMTEGMSLTSDVTQIQAFPDEHSKASYRKYKRPRLLTGFQMKWKRKKTNSVIRRRNQRY